MKSLFAGFLLLTALDAVLSSDASASRVGGALSGVATVVQHILSPTTPAIPDLRAKKPIWRELGPRPGGPPTVPGYQPPVSNTLPDDWTTKPTVQPI